MAANLSDKATLRKIRETINAALVEALAPLELSAAVASIRFDEGGAHAKMTLEVSQIGAGSMAEKHEADAFRMLAKVYGLEPDDLGRMVTISGRQMEIVGLRHRAQKRPIVCRGLDGKGFIVPEARVALALGRVPRK